MAGRCRRSSLIVPATTILLLLAASSLILAVSAAEDKKKAGTTRIRYANEEESWWLDRFAETHEPLEGGRGPLLMRRATEEEARRMDSLRKPTDGGGDVLEFDQDNPY
ncbi:hypothetical protein QOZ80_5BG0436930 [Eleusine coracana subsp. coracana]|nr:hypothetical protein QOZ80_5BG0436930 [Eleusine coracana subsp. coracana]